MSFAKDLKSRIQTSKDVVNENLMSSRKKMKEQFDKKAKQPQFSVGDIVMLWKPYKRKGVSGCFQPDWDGPWTINKFTGKKKVNCKIVRCGDSEKKLNVHISQLKLRGHEDQSNFVESDVQRIIPTELSTPSSNSFLDYLDDFEADEMPIIVQEQQQQQQQQQQHQIPQQQLRQEPQHQQIDQRWVSVDVDNIVPGGRTRGNRIDYAQFR